MTKKKDMPSVRCLTCKKCESIVTKSSYDPFHESLTGINCTAASNTVYPAFSCTDYSPRETGDPEPYFVCFGIKEE